MISLTLVLSWVLSAALRILLLRELCRLYKYDLSTFLVGVMRAAVASSSAVEENQISTMSDGLKLQLKPTSVLLSHVYHVLDPLLGETALVSDGDVG